MAIGIATNLSLKKQEVERAFDSLEEGVKFVEDNYAPRDVFDKTENGDYVSFKLKDQLLENGLTDFLRDFYAARIPDRPEAAEDIISTLGKAHTAEEILDLAKKQCWERFQYDLYWDSIFIREKSSKQVYLYTRGIDLSLDGKILMECYDGLFQFLSTVIQEKFSKHPISKALRVIITG
ncbi:MAG: hypothetical protein ACI30I_09555 [Parabacteroides sp.]